MKLTELEIQKSVHACIIQVAEEQELKLEELSASKKIVDDLGFSSLDVATLTALLEGQFKVDPFGMGVASITEIRTIQDICDLYTRCLNGSAQKQESTTASEAEKARLQKRLQKRVS